MAAEIYLPKMSDHMEEGTIIRWLVSEGETVTRGQVILEVETDKAVGEIEAPADGVLKGVRAGDGATVPVGETLAFIARPDENVPAKPPLGGGAPATEVAPPSDGPVLATPVARRVAKDLGVDIGRVQGSGPSGRVKEEDVRAYAAALAAAPATEVAPSNDANDGPVLATPVARRVAKDLGVDIGRVQGSGPGGRVKEEDVRAYAAALAAAPATEVAPSNDGPASAPRPEPAGAPPAQAAPTLPDGATLPLTQIQRITGQRMLESVHQAPHFFLQVSATMAAALRVVESARQQIEAETGARLSITAILVKAVSLALKKHPRANSSFQDNALALYPEVNIGVAVGAEDGLVVPVIKGADARSLAEIARELKNFQAKASEMRFSLEDLSGGTFTVSNLGMYGVDVFTAIINPPQSSILAVGRIIQTPTGMEDGSITLQPMMALTLSVDHRCMDGLQGAKFLAEIKKLLEEPYLML